MNPTLPAILLIEKDELTLEIYQRELCNCFTVFASTEINGVLETLAGEKIQAVVIEPEISAGQGWDLIETICKTFPERGLPVVVCSTRDVPRKNISRSIALYLTKPVLPRTLREKVQEVLESA
jgi:DNA-binding response OmpR family regulator